MQSAVDLRKMAQDGHTAVDVPGAPHDKSSSGAVAEGRPFNSSKPQKFQNCGNLPEADAGKTSPGVTTADGECSNQQMNDYLDKMHGWLLTVATLFVGMAFHMGAHLRGATRSIGLSRPLRLHLLLREAKGPPAPAVSSYSGLRGQLCSSPSTRSRSRVRWRSCYRCFAGVH